MAKHSLQTMLEDVGADIRSYSGRGMYGKECLGVDIPRGGLGEFLASVIEGTPEDHVSDIAQAFRGMQTDQMGLGTIVYFPDVSFTSDEEEEDDETFTDDDDVDEALLALRDPEG